MSADDEELRTSRNKGIAGDAQKDASRRCIGTPAIPLIGTPAIPIRPPSSSVVNTIMRTFARARHQETTSQWAGISAHWGWLYQLPLAELYDVAGLRVELEVCACKINSATTSWRDAIKNVCVRPPLHSHRSQLLLTATPRLPWYRRVAALLTEA